jgi:ATP-dependent exoDNAse (exonuclease V) beta subunit
MIVFDSDSHTYTNTETKDRYISTTTLLSRYKEPFDKEYHSLRVAKREGVPQEMVLEAWAAENKKSTDRGSHIHKLLENYVTVGEIQNDYRWLYRSYDNVINTSVDKFKTFSSEKLLYNHEYKLAGTADLIFDHGDFFTVGDFKTNKRFSFTSPYNEVHKDPIAHLSYCEFNTYALQLSIYAYMHEELTGKKCSKLVVFYLDESNFKPIHCNYLKTDVINILKHFQVNSKI